MVDLKTGVKAGEEIHDEHRKQLLFYAFSYFTVCGVYPAKAAIETLGGERLYFDVDSEAAEAVVQDAMARLEDYNRAINQHIPLRQLASPSSENCRYCDFRVACSAMFYSYGEDWDWSCPPFLGTVNDSARGRNGWAIDLEVEAPAHLAGQTVRFRDCPDSCRPPIPSRASVVGAMPTTLQREFRLTWESYLLVWTGTD